MNLSGFPSLISATVDGCTQSAVGITNTQPITNLDASSNALSSSQVDSDLIALDGNGLFAGTVDLSGQTPPAPPSAVGMARALSLIAKTWTVTLDPSIFIFDDGSGGFWQLIVDISGNVGTQATVGPATSDVILADGVGGFWKVVVDIAGNRGTTPDAGPATLVPALDDGAGGFWKLIVDALGNLGAQQIVPIAWAPATETVTWIDTNGTFVGDLSTFRSTADFATVSSLVFGATGNLTSITGIQELSALSILDLNTNALTTIDITNCTSLTDFNCSHNSSITSIILNGCGNLQYFDCSYCDITGVLDLTPSTILQSVEAKYNAHLTQGIFTGLTALYYLGLDACDITGTLDLSTCSAITDTECSGLTHMTNVDIGSSVNWMFPTFWGCSLSAACVNDVLNKLATNCLSNGGVCALNAGTSSAPTVGPPNGVAAKALLITNGWAVSTN